MRWRVTRGRRDSSPERHAPSRGDTSLAPSQVRRRRGGRGDGRALQLHHLPATGVPCPSAPSCLPALPALCDRPADGPHSAARLHMHPPPTAVSAGGRCCAIGTSCPTVGKTRRSPFATSRATEAWRIGSRPPRSTCSPRCQAADVRTHRGIGRACWGSIGPVTTWARPARDVSLVGRLLPHNRAGKFFRLVVLLRQLIR